MAAQTAAPLVNGIAPHFPPSVNEALEYEKILKLRDEVFAGTHPRLVVPAHALQNFSQPPQPPLTAQTSLALPTVASTSKSPISRQNDFQPSPIPFPTNNHGLAALAAASYPPLDPSDLTISAEIPENAADRQQLRKSLEAQLKKQFEKKKEDARKLPSPSESKPDFDLPSILEKAQKNVEPSKNDASDDSFDENSFYSSRAPDSTPERGPPSPTSQQNDTYTADGQPGARISAVMGAPLETDAGADADVENSPRYVPREADAMDVDDEEEEGEYSPPEAVEGETTADHSGQMQDSRDPRTRPLRRYSDAYDGARRPGSSEGFMRNVRYRSPLPFPQPSDEVRHILTEASSLQQKERQRRQRQQAGSPDPMQPRKKRKLEKQRKKGRNNALSPNSFVKTENVSPPPFNDVPELGGSRQPPNSADRPILIDDSIHRETRYVQDHPRYVDSVGRPISRHAERPMPLAEPRVLSRTSMRPVRDDQDLRRVASMHNMRVEPQHEYAEPAYETPSRRVASYREASPVVMDRPRIVDDYDRPLQEVRVSSTPSQAYRQLYRDEPQVRYELMPPPRPERIVVDELGNRYREVIVPERASVAPRATSVRPDDYDSPQHEQYRPMRSGSVFVDTPPERRFAQEMPPPPPVYRQSEAPRANVAMPVDRSASIQTMDRQSRQTVYLDEQEYRDRMRMGSIRPQYEDAPRETMARASSARPPPRDGNVFMDERAQPRREYLPAEPPRYRTIEPGERVYDAQGREILIPPGTIQRY